MRAGGILRSFSAPTGDWAPPRTSFDRLMKGARAAGPSAKPRTRSVFPRPSVLLSFLILTLALPACGGEGKAPAKQPAKAPAKAEEPAKDAEKEEAPKDVDLKGYKIALGPKRIRGVTNDASGLTYSPKTKTLFLVINGTSEIFELTLDGKVKRRIRTRGFVDLEGITHVDGDSFAVVEEGRGRLHRITIDEKATTINSGAGKGVVVDGSYLGNKGIEGVTYDPKGKRFFAVKEKSPRRIYQIAGLKVTHPWDIQKTSLSMSDLSGIYYHRKTGHLLVLSDESRCLVETTLDGREISRLSLRGMSQPEGVTMDGEDTIYVCSEPSIFAVYKKKAAEKKTEE